MIRKFTYCLVLAFYFLTNSVLAQSNGKISNSDYVKVYPNPITTEATIQIDHIDFTQHKVSFSVYNVVGKEVAKITNIKTNEVKFNRENLMSGVYIYQLKVDDKAQSTGRFIIR